MIMVKKLVSRDTPLAEITLRRYEKPNLENRRDFIKKVCLSIGLLQPGDSRDVIVDILIKKGYKIVEPPLMLRRKPYEGVTDLADFETMMYKVEDEDLLLIATSEHPIAAMQSGFVV